MVQGMLQEQRRTEQKYDDAQPSSARKPAGLQRAIKGTIFISIKEFDRPGAYRPSNGEPQLGPNYHAVQHKSEERGRKVRVR